VDPTGYQVALDVFEGPLDLLLHLVKKHELSILEIPISFVTEKYLEYLDAMAALDIDVAGEYLLMAATLCHIKSRELLPTPPPLDDDDEAALADGGDIDPRADLVRRLLEYQKYKEAAEQLGHRPVVGRNVWSRGAPTEDAVSEGIDLDAIAPLAPFPVHKLIEAFDRVMRQAKLPRGPHRSTERGAEDHRADRPLGAGRSLHVCVDVQVPGRWRGTLPRRGSPRSRRDVPGAARDGQAADDLADPATGRRDRHRARGRGPACPDGADRRSQRRLPLSTVRGPC